jgi:hypothetical protein
LKVALAFSMLALLAACGEDSSAIVGSRSDAGSALDKQAIAVGIMPDPADFEFTGRYETRSEIGTDKFCAVENGSKQFDIGLLAVYGPESKCEARGVAVIDGEKIRITLDGKGSCAFNARYDGIELRFPGTIESGCASYCSPRASLSGTHYFMIQPGDDAARNTLGRDIEKLCE